MGPRRTELSIMVVPVTSRQALTHCFRNDGGDLFTI